MKDVVFFRPFIRGTYFTKKRKKTFERLSSKYGLSAVAHYHQLALSFFIKDALQRLKNSQLPKEIIKFYRQWFDVALTDFSRQDERYYHHENIEFLMDVGVCSLRRIPVGGAWIVEIGRASWLPLLPVHVVDALKYFFCLVFSVKGFTPFCIIHTVSRYILRLNEKNMNLAYLNIARLMKQNPKIKGIYRRSWFLDPELDKISPHLAFFRRVPADNGATVFSAYTLPYDIQSSLVMSSKRKKLQETGKYVPKAYAYIWPRSKFLDWAEHQESLQTGIKTA